MRRIIFDEAQEFITPHPERKATFHDFSVVASRLGLQRIWCSGSQPPHLRPTFCKNVFLNCKSLDIRAPTIRPELSYQVLPIDTDALGISTFTALTRLVHHLRHQLADRERMLVFFKDNSLAEKFSERTNCAVYHSRLPIAGNTKDYNLFRWDSGDTRVLAATTAVAQGIHRDYVKHVVFFEGAYGAISFYQGAGRAGRKGEPSFVFILHDSRAIHCVSHGWKSVKDSRCDSAFQAFTNNRIFCRTEMLSSIMDGDKLAKKCNDIPDANPCDLCAPNSDVARFARQAITMPIPPLPPTPAPSDIRTPASSTGPPVAPSVASRNSDDEMFEPLEITSSVGRRLDDIASEAISKVSFLLKQYDASANADFAGQGTKPHHYPRRSIFSIFLVIRRSESRRQRLPSCS